MSFYKQNRMPHTNQTLLITGCGRRNGLFLTEHFLELGYQVVAIYRSESQQLNAIDNPNLIKLQADLTHIDDIKQFCQQVIELESPLAGVIHNASAYSPTAQDLDDALTQYDEFYQVHMKAPYLINRLLADKLKQSSESLGKAVDIVQITDIYVDNPKYTFDTYCSTKAGLANLTKSFAQTLAPHVKVNAIAPGPIKLKEDYSDEYKNKVFNQTVLGVEGGFEPIFLAIKALMENPYITGETLKVDGGRSLLNFVVDA